MSGRKRLALIFSYEAAGLAVLGLFVWLSVSWFPLWLPRVALSFETFLFRVRDGFSSLGGAKIPGSYLTPGFSLMASGVSYGPSGDGFYSGFVAWGWSLISLLSDALWFASVNEFLLRAMQVLLFALPLALVFKILFENSLSYRASLWTEVSKPLLAWYWISDHLLGPAIGWVVGFFRYFRASGFFAFSALFGLVVLNGVSEILDFAGMYVWFLGSADFVSVLDFIWTLLLTFLYDVRNVPLLAWVAIGFIIKNAAAFKAADGEIVRLWGIDRRTVMENMGTFTLIVGLMRTGKDVISVLICTLLQAIFRQNALESMKGFRSMFPWFPWIWLERQLDGMIRLELDDPHRVVNGVQGAAYVETLFYGDGTPKPELQKVLEQCRRPEMYFNNGIVFVSLSAAMGEYAKQYFIYGVYSSLVIGNGDIRTYDDLADLGHSKLWDVDILHRTSKQRSERFLQSHVIDEDMMRLKKKVVPGSDAAWLAGPAIVYISEYGKDVGNSKTNAGKKINDDDANALNDGSVWFQQMGGQLAEADHNHYFKMVTNEQRVSAISSERIQVAQSIWAIDVKQIEEKTALRLWWLEPAFLQKVIDVSDRFLDGYGFYREDRSLGEHFASSCRSLASGILKRAENLYCYKEYRIPECRVDASGNLAMGDPIVFYDIFRVSRADAFDSAFLRGFFERFLLGAKRGLYDQPVFQGLTPTLEEFEAQHSYMVDAMKEDRRDGKQA